MWELPDTVPGMTGTTDLERFWKRRRALSFDELCRGDRAALVP